MKYLDLTLSTPEQNLAGDEALLDGVEQGRFDAVLRFWEPREYFVVLGYAGRIDVEINIAAWKRHPIPVLRRCSGGAAVLQGPGCLNYSLILRIPDSGPLCHIHETNAFIMNRQKEVLESVLGEPVSIQGTTDLTLGGRKFSGNSQRRRQWSLLFHGTFLLSLNLDLVEHLLAAPVRQPCYRENRRHKEFLKNLDIPAQGIKAAMCKSWGAAEEFDEVPRMRIDRLAQEKYSQPGWRFDPAEVIPADSI